MIVKGRVKRSPLAKERSPRMFVKSMGMMDAAKSSALPYIEGVSEDGGIEDVGVAAPLLLSSVEKETH